MKPHILVVDDSLTVRMDLRGALSAAGFVVTTCETKRAAELALSERHFSLVVLDVILPDGSGIDLLRAIREDPARRGLPVVLLSTEAEVRDRVRGLSTGADEYVGKPYDIAYLIRRVRALCEDRTPVEDASAPALPGGRRILAVDDSPTYLAELARKLREDGHDVVLARSGLEALDLLRIQAVDCVVLDLVMPEIDGFETLRRMRRLPGREATPTVMLTASEDPSHLEHAFIEGADEFVRKTIDLDQLRTKIRSLLRRKAGVRGRAPTGNDELSKPPSTRGGERARVTPPRGTSALTGVEAGLFAKAVTETGLSAVLGRDLLSKALRRAGVDPGAMSSVDFLRALPAIRDALGMFYPADEAARRAARIARAAHEGDLSRV